MAQYRGDPLYFCIALRDHRFHAPSEVSALAEACLRFTPDITLRKDTRPAIFLEASRCRALYSPESLEARLRVLLRDFGLRPEDYRIARAGTLPKAWLCANQGVAESAFTQLPITTIEDLIDPLARQPEEKRRIGAMIEILFALGVRSIGALRKLPPDSAVSRFGTLYETLLGALRETVATEFTWERFRPTERFIERIDLLPDDSIWDLEPTLFQAKSLIDRVLKRAFGRGKAIVAIEFRLECERRRNALEVALRVPIRFTFPQTSASIILRTLREKLSFEFGRRELEAPIMAYELEVTELSPRTGIQDSFMDEGESAVTTEAFRELVSELGTKLSLGGEVYQAELAAVWRPERSWRKTVKDATTLVELRMPIPERPLTMLTPPEPLRRLGRYFFWNDERYRIREFAQIERLSGEWWEDDGGFTRTYYRVRVEASGEDEPDREFWIFREQRNEAGEGGLFLHGIF